MSEGDSGLDGADTLLLRETEDFVRRVLNETFKQNEDDATIRSVAIKIMKTMPRKVRKVK